MRQELSWGVANTIGADRIIMIGVTKDEMRVSVLRGASPGTEEFLNVPVGGSLEVGGSLWRLVSVHTPQELPSEDDPPGSVAGQLAAVIEQ